MITVILVIASAVLMLASLPSRAYWYRWYGYSGRLLDGWSTTHVGHGIVLYGTARSAMPNDSVWWSVAVAVGFEFAWEWVENTKMVIGWFRSAGDDRYEGDSAVNSLGDVLCCAAGALVTSLFV